MIEAVAKRLEEAPRQLRRRWSDEFKAQVVAEALEPGASISGIAHRIGIHLSQLFAWRLMRGPNELTPRSVESRSRDGVHVSDQDCHWRGGRARRPACRGGAFTAGDPGGPIGMIPSGVKVFLASHPVDFRKGIDGLVALVRDAGSDPFDGAIYVFRAKRADRIKIVWWDGSGVCLYLKRLEQAKFCWPRIGHHRVQLNPAQLVALVDGMD
ncbi:IS66 family insertion sequence element accessory protein TnpB [Bradyrhizobium sp. CCBAU 53380]|uniref:IS66 family insertion sequence element accessory protein TnpB n=1 Tax=Bradyrhizobium sp. CCBAU 53380 TaxID=1325117 RepID=UPI0023040875|nr:IS66 family insertion sequence element accessory protein TnpB [Bradyrhizobium sp. CCBAU 53380]